MKRSIIILLMLHAGILMASENEMRLAKMNFLINTKNYKGAIKELALINVKLIPQDKKALFYNKAGFINYCLKRTKTALKNYYTALTINSNLHFVYNNIGVTYFSSKEYEKAKKYYLKAYDKRNNYPRVLVNLAVVEFYLGKYLSAYTWFKKALSCDEKYVDNRFDREKALNKLEDWVKQNPDDKDLKKMLEWARENTDRDITNINY